MAVVVQSGWLVEGAIYATEEVATSVATSITESSDSGNRDVPIIPVTYTHWEA